MRKRAPAVRRTPQPLSPRATVIFVNGAQVVDLALDQITVAKIGVKAFGLASIPQVWTKPFFVVSGDVAPTPESLLTALQRSGLTFCERLIVRSSGVMESLDQRGSLESAECYPNEIGGKITGLKELLAKKKGARIELVHWIVQNFVAPSAKGHLSNERRLCEALRDWVAEVEPSPEHASETHRIAIKTWRDARISGPQELACKYRDNYIDKLKVIASWAYERQLRVHFEWVWDGQTVYVVQADECYKTPHGVDPKKLVKVPRIPIRVDQISVFRIAKPSDFETYRKLNNARLYKNLGYKIVDFFVLDDVEELRQVLNEGRCSDKLVRDLHSLTRQPLVIRTDGLDIPAEKHQMLPRSDELRSAEGAQKWLLNNFRDQIKKMDLDGCHLCLIAHHFVPAAASAWCQAHPDRRRVRIESLWGIPEGLYWYAHDVFDVDTLTSSVPLDSSPPKSLPIKERLRYKGRFIAPNESGEWVLHQTADGPDWQRSIHREQWIKEIAWSSRRIAVAQGKPVVVMWLIDIPDTVSTHPVMPWYHEEWKNEGDLPKAAPRKKLSLSTEFVLHTEFDWRSLQEQCLSGAHIARVVVDPVEPELVRDQQFSKALAALAKEKHFVVELSGGILSHAYYLLTSSGCEVECADLYAAEDEELEFNKLVRDRIPDSIVARGENVGLLRLEGEALIAALKRKIVEEAFEVLDSKTSQQVVEELADLREVMDALGSQLGIQEEAVDQARHQKAKSRGSFDKGLMLTRTVLASSIGANEAKADDSFLFFPQPADRTISRVAQLPSCAGDIHVDKRYDSHGTAERQITMKLPAHAFAFKPQIANFTLDTQDGYPHEVMLEVRLERVNTDLRCILRLINAPVQLNLPLLDASE